MHYVYTSANVDYTDFAPGRVFQSFPGHVAFPVRLASELFQRCQALRARRGATRSAVVYDPCCGSGYLLGVLPFLHWDGIARLVGSDADAEVLTLAGRNLALVTPEGMQERRRYLEVMRARFGKISHADALDSLARLHDVMARGRHRQRIDTALFPADATDEVAMRRHVACRSVDIVVTDVPYGWATSWKAGAAVSVTRAPESDPVARLLAALRPLLAKTAVVAIGTTKGPARAYGGFERLQRLRIGKREVTFLAPVNEPSAPEVHTVRSKERTNGCLSHVDGAPCLPGEPHRHYVSIVDEAGKPLPDLPLC